MRIQLTIIGLIFISSSLFGQSKKECNQLLNKEISSQDFSENIDEFFADFKTLIICEFEEIDYQIFMGPQGNMPLIAHSLISFAGNTQNNEKYTFKDLKDLLLSFKNEVQYSEVRQIVEAQNDIIDKKASVKNWKVDEQLLIKMGLLEKQLDEVYAIVRENEYKKYSEIFVIYSDTLNAQKERQLIEIEKKSADLKKQNPGSTEWVEGLITYDSYDMGMKKSQETNKPLLLYFTGYACVNARKIEGNILTEYDIQNYINSNLIFVSLFVDDKSKLNESEMFHSEVLNKQIKTVGQKNLEIQIIQFQTNAQPLFILLDIDGKEVSRIEYTTDINKFSDFLKIIEK